MKLTKEDVENAAIVHQTMLDKAEDIWSTLKKLDPNHYEYFTSIDDLSFDDNHTAYVSGYDGNGHCSINIPLEYFYSDDWFEKAKKKMEEREEKRRLDVEKIKLVREAYDEKHEREEYERLKKKFG